jgi:phosphoserine phosphatase
MQNKSVVVVVDFDETLVIENTLLLLYKISESASLFKAVAFSFIKFRWINVGLHRAIKEEMYLNILRGKTEKQLLVIAGKLSEAVNINEAVWKRVNKLTDNGARLVIATASLVTVVEEILRIKEVSVDEVIGTTAKIISGTKEYSGELNNGECEKEEKRERVINIMKQNYINHYIFGFGNLPADREMLKIVDEGYVVNGAVVTPFIY